MKYLLKAIEQGKFPLFFLSLLVLSSSCTEDADLKSFDLNEHKVLNSLVCPGKDIKFYLNAASPFSIDSFQNLLNPEIKLFENNELVESAYVFTEDFYFIPYSVRNEFVYRWEVTFPDKSVLSCEDTIPDDPPDISAYYDYPVYSDEFGIRYGRLHLEFKDIASKSNYYEIAFTDKNYTHLASMKVTHPVISLDTEKNPFPTPVLLFDDALFENNDLKMDIYLQAAENPKIIIRNVSLSYYKYKKSLYPHLYTQNTDRENVYDFFKGDPIDTYSNINGGLGIFASYSERIFDSFDKPTEN